jgi:hypothetical protein
MSHSARPAQKAHSDHLPQSLKLCPHSDTENAFGLPEVLPHLSSSSPRPLPYPCPKYKHSGFLRDKEEQEHKNEEQQAESDPEPRRHGLNVLQAEAAQGTPGRSQEPGMRTDSLRKLLSSPH